ncbi:hypothetical protein DY000_02052862 [Brassica cretica]|uniref:Uncharacterized protein n=1 Tax=Brassica cretica TaxID=69181 RepID=A0ABQ7AGG0_BRACR|nr:hypothetical protein DY000_02052862 [Brassica cretica]
MFSTQLSSSSKKNQIKRSSYVTVMPFTNQVIFSSRELRPPEKLEMANLLSDEPTTNSIMPKFLKHSKGLDHFEESLELDFCARNSFDSFVFKDNSFNLSCYRYALITGNLFASTCALDEFIVKTLLEQKSLRAKTDFCYDSVLKSDLELLYSNSDHVRHVLKMFYDISCLESILIYNTFFDKSSDPWISNSRSIMCPDTILVYNTYFDRLHDDLKRVLHVLGKETLVSDLNKYLSCTYDPEHFLFLGEEKSHWKVTKRPETGAFELFLLRLLIDLKNNTKTTSFSGSAARRKNTLGLQVHEDQIIVSFRTNGKHGPFDSWRLMSFTDLVRPSLDSYQGQIPNVNGHQGIKETGDPRHADLELGTHGLLGHSNRTNRRFLSALDLMLQPAQLRGLSHLCLLCLEQGTHSFPKIPLKHADPRLDPGCLEGMSVLDHLHLPFNLRRLLSRLL